jgi:hypothetical protein
VRIRLVSAFDVEPDGSRDRPRLDPVEFSRFKHGAVAPAWRFAEELVQRVATDCPDVFHAPHLVVTASCFKYVPLASATLARCAGHLLNTRRAAVGAAPVTSTQFFRAQLIEGDYSTMTLDERERFIAQDVVRIDTEVLADAAVLVLDDVRITGLHESRLAAVLDEAGVPEAVFAYCAIIEGRADPTIEKQMNQAAIGDLDALADLMRAGGFRLNSRVCKLILGAPPAALTAFLDRLPATALDQLVTGLECNGYAVMGRYRTAYEAMLARAGAGVT